MDQWMQASTRTLAAFVRQEMEVLPLLRFIQGAAAAAVSAGRGVQGWDCSRWNWWCSLSEPGWCGKTRCAAGAGGADLSQLTGTEYSHLHDPNGVLLMCVPRQHMPMLRLHQSLHCCSGHTLRPTSTSCAPCCSDCWPLCHAPRFGTGKLPACQPDELNPLHLRAKALLVLFTGLQAVQDGALPAGSVW